VRRFDVDFQLGHQPGEARRLARRQVQDEPSQGRGVDDRVLQRLPQPAADEPGVESVVAVLHQHGASREAQEGFARVSELGRADEHLLVDLVPLPRVGVDRGAAPDQGVEEGQRLVQPETLSADLEDQERPVARGFDVEGDELRLLQRRQRAHVLRVDSDLLPGHWRGGAARLQERFQYAFLCVNTRNSVIRMILRSNARLQFSM
jgi:hypothetical protein